MVFGNRVTKPKARAAAARKVPTTNKKTQNCTTESTTKAREVRKHRHRGLFGIPRDPIRGTDRATCWPPSLRYSSPRGFVRPGMYCYRRALIQALLHIPAIYNYLGQIGGCRQAEEACVVRALQGLFDKYWNARTARAFPREKDDDGAVAVLDEAINALCQGGQYAEFASRGQQCDPHELLTFLYAELREKQWPARNRRLQNLLIVRHAVSWTCDECGKTRRTNTENLGIQLHLQPQKKRQQKLTDLLRGYHADTVEIACANCQRCNRDRGPGDFTADRTRSFAITAAPEILAIHLSRVSYRGKVTDKVEYPEILDLTEFARAGKNKDGPWYKLYSVVAHSGATAQEGHYIAAVRRRDGKGFCTINDDMPIETFNGVEELLDPQFQRQRFDSVILFYAKLNSLEAGDVD